MGCIMTPMPNHLSTLKPHREVWRTHSTQLKNHTKQCGKGSDVEQMRRVRWKCGDGEDEWLVEKGYMTTPSVDEEK